MPMKKTSIGDFVHTKKFMAIICISALIIAIIAIVAMGPSEPTIPSNVVIGGDFKYMKDSLTSSGIEMSWDYHSVPDEKQADNEYKIKATTFDQFLQLANSENITKVYTNYPQLIQAKNGTLYHTELVEGAKVSEFGLAANELEYTIWFVQELYNLRATTYFKGNIAITLVDIK